ncbi:MAG: hypothetical protein E7004_01870 [Alphaproteobacteria bacterium]|nr:hypothetical protein [Alphaproteobacteria bacterium]
MNFIKNNICTLFMLTLFLVCGFGGDAMAQSVVDTARSKLGNVFQSIKSIVFILGGFGLVGVAWAAIWGRIQWKWFGALAVGLAIVAAAGSIVEYATGTQVGDLGSNTFGAQ